MQLVPETPNGPAAPTTSTSRILAETLAALRSTDDEVALVHGRPRGPRWVRLSEALQDATTLRVWLTATGTAADDPERVATMFLASWLAGTLIEPVARSVIRHGRGWTLDPATLHVRPTDAGWFDGLAIGDGATVLVAADDPAAGQRGVRVLATTAEVRDATATQVATLGAEVLAGLRSVRPIGAPAFWGSLADAIAGSLVFDVEADGGDVEATFRDVRSFMDAVGRVVAIGRARPELVPVAWSGGLAHEVRRGTCCLWYRTQVDPDPAGEGYCGTCPRRDPEDQCSRWVRSREETAAVPAADPVA